MGLINYYLWELLKMTFMVFANLMLGFAIAVIVGMIVYVIFSILKESIRG